MCHRLFGLLFPIIGAASELPPIQIDELTVVPRGMCIWHVCDVKDHKPFNCGKRVIGSIQQMTRVLESIPADGRGSLVYKCMDMETGQFLELREDPGL